MQSIKCLTTDKSNGFVILNTDDYIEQMSIIIQDKSKFKELNFDSQILVHKRKNVFFSWKRKYFCVETTQAPQ